MYSSRKYGELLKKITVKLSFVFSKRKFSAPFFTNADLGKPFAADWISFRTVT